MNAVGIGTTNTRGDMILSLVKMQICWLVAPGRTTEVGHEVADKQSRGLGSSCFR